MIIIAKTGRRIHTSANFCMLRNRSLIDRRTGRGRSTRARGQSNFSAAIYPVRREKKPILSQAWKWVHFIFVTVAIPTAQRAVIIQPRAKPWGSMFKIASGLKGRDMALEFLVLKYLKKLLTDLAAKDKNLPVR
jgi:hypothetical protein